MKMIPLSLGIAAIVDDEDYEGLSKFRWHAVARGNTFYAVRNGGEGEPKTIIMHRVIMKPQQGQIIDHIDGIGINNQKENLRPCTTQQNSFNAPARGGSSRFKGVKWSKRKNRWLAVIYEGRKQKQLGSFLNEIDAAKAYDAEALIRHGEFARLNISTIPNEDLGV